MRWYRFAQHVPLGQVFQPPAVYVFVLAGSVEQACLKADDAGVEPPPFWSEPVETERLPIEAKILAYYAEWCGIPLELRIK